MSRMISMHARSIRHCKTQFVLAVLLSLTLLAPLPAFGGKKKHDTPKKPRVIDYSNIVWPNPPAIARIRYLAFYSAQPLRDVEKPKTKKEGWMDRLAGTVPQEDNTKVLFQLGQPYGLATDSKGRVYVADSKVG